MRQILSETWIYLILPVVCILGMIIRPEMAVDFFLILAFPFVGGLFMIVPVLLGVLFMKLSDTYKGLIILVIATILVCVSIYHLVFVNPIHVSDELFPEYEQQEYPR